MLLGHWDTSALAPGTYTLRVEVNLPDGDPQGLGPSAAFETLTVTLGGEANSGGCAAGAPTILAALMGLAFLVRRRRR